jgi:5-methyltetrahydrofolate--homocysteine methyltransferase
MRWLGNKRPPFCGCTRNVSGDFKEKKLTAKAVYGFSCESNDDDIELTDENGTITNILDIASTVSKNKDAPNIALADFIAPKDNGVDYMGCFV